MHAQKNSGLVGLRRSLVRYHFDRGLLSFRAQQEIPVPTEEESYALRTPAGQEDLSLRGTLKNTVLVDGVPEVPFGRDDRSVKFTTRRSEAMPR